MLRLQFDSREILHRGIATVEPFLQAFQACQELFARFAAADCGRLALYGATVAVGGRALLILGPSGVGKTVLALHLVEHGARFLGDETAVLDIADGAIAAMPCAPALRESSLSLLPDVLRSSVTLATPMYAFDSGRLWYALKPDDLAGIAPDGTSYPVGAIAILTHRAGFPSVTPVSTDVALRAVASRAYARTTGLAQVAALRELLSVVPSFEVALGAADVTAALVVKTLERRA